MKFSIIIPTFNRLDLLSVCLDSVIKNTSLNDTEVIVVSNGCTDGTLLHLLSLKDSIDNLRIISVDEPIGFPMAVNMGIKVARGEFLVLLNNDCRLYDQSKDSWVDTLCKPFSDKAVGIVGPKKLYCEEVKSDFVVFFCAMLRKKMIEDIGNLDEIFAQGSSEDIDLCLRAKKNGWKIEQVAKDNSFPMFHHGGLTVHELEGWEDKIYKKNLNILKRRFDVGYYSTHANVTCEVSTKGRYDTTLPLAIEAIASQSLKPKKLIIFQDDTTGDLRERSLYSNLFSKLDRAGIEWCVLFGEGKGQVLNHQKVLDMATTEWIWRVDDDNVPESNVLERLFSIVEDNVGAVSCSVLDPISTFKGHTSSRLVDIYSTANTQWVKGVGVVEAEHLYSTFLYRKSAASPYCMNLSPVGHREETMFTYEIYKNGWKLLIDRGAVVWHYRERSGGIRSYSDASMWERDERVFKQRMMQHGIRFDGDKEDVWVNLDCGLGDHWLFKSILNKVLETRSGVIRIACCFPSVFNDVTSNRVRLHSVGEGLNILGKGPFDELNVYRFCDERKWNKTIKEAFEKMYTTQKKFD